MAVWCGGPGRKAVWDYHLQQTVENFLPLCPQSSESKTSVGILDRSSRNQQMCKELHLSRNPKVQSFTIHSCSQATIQALDSSSTTSGTDLEKAPVQAELVKASLLTSVQIFWIPLSPDGNITAVSLVHFPSLSIGWFEDCAKAFSTPRLWTSADPERITFRLHDIQSKGP